MKPYYPDPLSQIQSRWAAVQQAHRAEEDARRALREARAELREATAELDRCLTEMQPGTHPLYDAAEQARATAPPNGTPEPRCHRCGATGGDMADLPSLADHPTDLIPADVCDIRILAPLGIPEEQAESYHVCLKCHDELLREALQPEKSKGNKGKKDAAKAPPAPEPITRATPLNVVLPADVGERAKVLEALYTASLRTVGDVLDRAAARTGGYVQQILATIHCTPSLPHEAGKPIAEAILRASLPLPDLSAQAPLPVPPVKAPANEIPEPPADPLAIPCPQCKAEAAQKCRNYKGQNCAPHRERLKAGKAVSGPSTKPTAGSTDDKGNLLCGADHDPLLDNRPRSVCCGCGQAGDIMDIAMATVESDEGLRELALKDDDLLPVSALADEFRELAERHFSCNAETDMLCGVCLGSDAWTRAEPESLGKGRRKAKGAKA